MARSADPASLLESNGVIKRYAAVEALRGVSFAVGAGSVVGLVGDAGAGRAGCAA